MQINNAAPMALKHLEGIPFKAIITVRDPRDIIVSGYFYHMTTHEPWVHQPRSDYGGKSYQEVSHFNLVKSYRSFPSQCELFCQALRSVGKTDGLSMEVDLITGGLWGNGTQGLWLSSSILQSS